MLRSLNSLLKSTILWMIWLLAYGQECSFQCFPINCYFHLSYASVDSINVSLWGIKLTVGKIYIWWIWVGWKTSKSSIQVISNTKVSQYSEFTLAREWTFVPVHGLFLWMFHTGNTEADSGMLQTGAGQFSWKSCRGAGNTAAGVVVLQEHVTNFM